MMVPNESASDQLVSTRHLALALTLVVLALPLAAQEPRVGARGEAESATAQTFGVHGISHGTAPGSAGLVGECTAPLGQAPAVYGRVRSVDGYAGLFEAPPGAKILRGRFGPAEVFSVSHLGVVTATAFIADGTDLHSYSDLECGGCVDGSEIPQQSLNASHLAVGAVGGVELLDGAVGAVDLANSAIQAPHLAADAVTAAKLAIGSVHTVHLAPGTVANDNLAINSVGPDQIVDHSVTRAKINGVERPVYRVVTQYCVEASNTETTLPTCVAEVCSDGTFADCVVGACGSAVALCPNELVGYLLAPDILP